MAHDWWQETVRLAARRKANRKVGQRERPPAPCGAGGLGFSRLASVLDRRPNRAEDVADRAAQEQEGHDGNDRDEGEDQRVLRETLAFVVTPEGIDESCEELHGVSHLLSSVISPDRWRVGREP